MTAPNGCAHCGVEARDHVQRWKPPDGWHRWAAPSQEQIKARMVARRTATAPDPSASVASPVPPASPLGV